MNAIELHGVSKDYGPVRALDGVDLEVETGQIFGFLGPNGAGKTTAIRILFDLIRPTRGRAAVLGLDCQTQGVEARARMGYLAGEISLYEGLTGRQTIDLFASMRPGKVQQPYLNSLLDRLDLDPARNVGAYSKGNRQKLGLVLALMHRPELLVLDEPTSGLDPLVQESVAQLLAEAAAAGSTVFFSSHVLSEVERMCHRVGIIRSGRIVVVEDIDVLKGRSLHLLAATFAHPVPPDAFENIEGVRVLSHDESSVRLEVRSNIDAAVKALARFPLTDLRSEQASLEDVFLAYYEDRPQLAQPEAQRADA